MMNRTSMQARCRARMRVVVQVLVLALVMVMTVAGPTVAFARAESEASIIRKVRGEVVAINVKDSPSVIVVKTMTAKNQELIVGATVDPSVEITRGKQRVSLQDIKVGEAVDLTYLKNPNGLTARSIRAR